jgi:hypothetical protein
MPARGHDQQQLILGHAAGGQTGLVNRSLDEADIDAAVQQFLPASHISPLTSHIYFQGRVVIKK